MLKQKSDSCQICGKICMSKWILKEHERLHTGEKPLQCSHCEKSFRAKQGLYVHIRTHHSKTVAENCDQCGKTFNYKRGLIKHLSKDHGKVTGFNCDECNEEFMTAKSLDSHSKNPCFKASHYLYHHA